MRRSRIGAHLLDEATPIVGKLGKFKVTTDTLKDFKARIEAFEEVRLSPRDAIKQSAAATKRLPRLFRKLRVLLTKRLDPLVAPFQETNPELHSEYKTARKLDSPASAPKAKEKKQTEAASKPEASSDQEVKVLPKPGSSSDKSKTDSSSDGTKVA